MNRISFPRVSSINTAIYRSLGKGQYFNPPCSNFPGIIQPDCACTFSTTKITYFTLYIYIYIYTHIYPLSHLIYALITWSRYDNAAKIAQICRVTRYSCIHDFHGLINFHVARMFFIALLFLLTFSTRSHDLYYSSRFMYDEELNELGIEISELVESLF